MEVKQIATILNTVLGEMTGETNVVSEDLSNIVDVGGTIEDLVSDSKTLEKFLGSLHDHIGKVIFADDRLYEDTGLGLKRDSWEYGGLLEKIYISLPDATENDTWALESGKKYDDILVYSPPAASAKFFDKMTTYDIPISYADNRVIRTAFSNAAQLSAFFGAVENRIRTAYTFYNKMAELRTINNVILEKAAENKIVNLLALYNAEGHPGVDLQLTSKDVAITTPAFLRWASAKIAEFSDFMTTLSTQFSDGGYERQSPRAYQKFFALSRFARNVEVFSESDTYHNEFVKLIPHEKIPCWQGVKYESRVFDFETCSTVLGKPASGSDDPIYVEGVVGVLMDRDCCAVCNENYRVTSFYNAGNETIKYYHKWDNRYMSDLNENAVVFAIQDINAEPGE